jgi:hypothetical protein
MARHGNRKNRGSGWGKDKTTRISGSCGPRKSARAASRITSLEPRERELLAGVARLCRGGALATQKALAARLARHQSWVSRLLLRMEERGFIAALPGSYPKAYQPTQKGWTACIAIAEADEVMRPITGSDEGPHNLPYPLNAHNMRVKVPVHRLPGHDDLIGSGWVFDQKMGWPRYTGFAVEGVSIHITPDNLVIFLPEIWTGSRDGVSEKATHLLERVLSEFSRRYPSVVLGTPVWGTDTTRVEAKITQQHIALVGDEFAKRMKASGRSVRTDRFEVDASAGPA